MQGGWRQPSIIEEPKIETIGNYMPSGHDASRIVDTNGLAPTVKENHGTITAITEQKLPGAYGRNFGSKGKIQDTESECDTLQAAMGNGGGNVPIIYDEDKCSEQLEYEEMLKDDIEDFYKENQYRNQDKEEKILVNNGTKKGYDEAIEGDSINISYPDSKTRRGRVDIKYLKLYNVMI